MKLIELNTICPFCRSTDVVKVSEKGMSRWKSGELIQTALPNLSVAERERVERGICSRCWP